MKKYRKNIENYKLQFRQNKLQEWVGCIYAVLILSGSVET